MAKKPVKSDRQAVIEQMRKQQRGSERRRGLAIVGVCALIALAIIVAAAWKPVMDSFQQRKYSGESLASIGAPASACQEPTTKKATGNQDHVEPGTPITYTDAPPAFGQHYSVPDPMARKMYTAGDRPELGTLVHNLEHGYTVLWYDDTIAKDSAAMDQIKAIAAKFEGTTNLRDKFKAVPWTAQDEHGRSFPKGGHVALTHWSAGGAAAASSGDTSKQVGVWQYCSKPSGAALQSFMSKYPYLDSPEPNGA